MRIIMESYAADELPLGAKLHATIVISMLSIAQAASAKSRAFSRVAGILVFVFITMSEGKIVDPGDRTTRSPICYLSAPERTV